MILAKACKFTVTLVQSYGKKIFPPTSVSDEMIAISF